MRLRADHEGAGPNIGDYSLFYTLFLVAHNVGSLLVERAALSGALFRKGAGMPFKPEDSKLLGFDSQSQEPTAPQQVTVETLRQD